MAAAPGGHADGIAQRTAAGSDGHETGIAPTPRQLRLERSAARRIAGLHCALEHCEDRGNRAAMLRTAEALGLLHIHEVAPVGHEQGRARGVAGGGEKWLQVHVHATAAELRAALPSEMQLLAALPPASGASTSWHCQRRKRKRTAAVEAQQSAEVATEAVSDTTAVEMEATSPQPGEPGTERPAPHLMQPIALEAIDFSRPICLIFGNERLGLSSETLAACDGAFHIPLHGLTESLNVSVAAAIAMHFGRFAREAALKTSGGLNASGGDQTEEQVAELMAEYTLRGKHHAKS